MLMGVIVRTSEMVMVIYCLETYRSYSVHLLIYRTEITVNKLRALRPRPWAMAVEDYYIFILPNQQTTLDSYEK